MRSCPDTDIDPHSLHRRYEQRPLEYNRIFGLIDPTVQQNCYQRGPAAAKPNFRVHKIAMVRGRQGR